MVRSKARLTPALKARTLAAELALKLLLVAGDATFHSDNEEGAACIV
jgi:hypothetical protein